MTSKIKMNAVRAKRYSTDLSRFYKQPITRVSLVVVLSILIVSFFLAVALKPTFVTIAKLNHELDQSEKTLTKLKAKTQALSQASKIWESIKPALPYIYNSMPTNEAEYAKLSKSIEVVAKESRVSITSLTLGKTVIYSRILDVFNGADKEVVAMPITVRVVGSFPDALNFLESMLKIDRLIKIKSLTINKEVEAEKSATVGVSITGEVNYLANKKLLNKLLDEGGK